MKTATNAVKHTPGPWSPVYSVMHERTVIATFDEGLDYPNAVIAIINSTLHEINEEPSPVDRANARLIAAAPELLEALKTILAHLDPDGDHPRHQHNLCSDCIHPTDDDKSIVDYLRAAIAKAEGN